MEKKMKFLDKITRKWCDIAADLKKRRAGI